MHSDENDGKPGETNQNLNVTDSQIENVFQAGRDLTVNITKSPPPSSLHNIPAPPADFTGRTADLEALTAPGAGTLISGMHGMGGIGKTALAYAAAARLAEHYPDAQVLVELRGTSEPPVTPLEAMAAVIHRVQPDARVPDDLGEARARYLSVLHGLHGILLLDNARDAAQVDPLLPPLGWRVLVTSRNHFVVQGMRSLHLEVLPDDEAHLLVRTIAGRLTQPQVERLSKLCGCLPLALRVTASALAVSISLPVKGYLDDLADLGKRLKLTTVDAALQASYDLLPEMQRANWRMLAVFKGSFNHTAAAAVWDADPGAANLWLEELRQRSLLDYDANTGRFSLHDLARLFAAGQQGAGEGEEAAGRHGGYYLEVLRSARELYKGGGTDGQVRGLQAFDLERHNIEAGQNWAAAHQADSQEMARLCSDYPDAGVYVLSLRLHPRQRIAWLESALLASRTLSDRAAEGVHLGNLGIAFWNLGEPRRAIEYYEQALVISREIGDRRAEGNQLGNLGNAYAALGEPRQAIEYYEQALVIAHEIGDRRGEGARLGNLGLAYADLGEPRQAIEYHEQSLGIKREIGDRRGEGNSLGNLGIAYKNLGEPRQAIEYYEQALAIAREIGDRRGEGNHLGNLGIAYKNLGEPRKAIEYHEQALVISREIGDRRAEGNHLGNLGSAYADLGEPRKAIEYHEQALVIAHEIGDRRGEGNQEFNSAVAYEKLGDRSAALPHARRALELFIAIESPYAERGRELVASLEEALKR